MLDIQSMFHTLQMMRQVMIHSSVPHKIIWQNEAKLPDKYSHYSGNKKTFLTGGEAVICF